LRRTVSTPSEQKREAVPTPSSTYPKLSRPLGVAERMFPSAGFGAASSTAPASGVRHPDGERRNRASGAAPSGTQI